MYYFSFGKNPNRRLESQGGVAGRDPRDLLGEPQISLMTKVKVREML